MATIKETAESYQPKKMRNIAELQSVPTTLQVMQDKDTDPMGVEFTYHYVELSGERYRIPGKVLGDLKAILSKKPNLANFCVTKKGEGKSTQYTVISLD